MSCGGGGGGENTYVLNIRTLLPEVFSLCTTYLDEAFA